MSVSQASGVNKFMLRKPSPTDLGGVVIMMGEFYLESPYTLNPQRAAAGFSTLLADERLGRVWFIQSNLQDVGYVVLTLCYSMEYGGMAAVVDDFFIRRAFRGAGLGRAALAEVRTFCLDYFTAKNIECPRIRNHH